MPILRQTRVKWASTVLRLRESRLATAALVKPRDGEDGDAVLARGELECFSALQAEAFGFSPSVGLRTGGTQGGELVGG